MSDSEIGLFAIMEDRDKMYSKTIQGVMIMNVIIFIIFSIFVYFVIYNFSHNKNKNRNKKEKREEYSETYSESESESELEPESPYSVKNNNNPRMMSRMMPQEPGYHRKYYGY